MRLIAASMLLALLTASSPSFAQQDDFYRGKTVTIVTGSPPGGGFDLVARLVGRHIGRNIPGRPTVIVQNMPGASGLRTLDYLASAAPRDGTTFGMTLPSSYLTRVTDPAQNIKPYQMTWIGRVSAFRAFGVVRSDAPLTSISQKEATGISMGAEGPTGLSALVLSALNDLYGSKFKIINGYNGNRDVGLAIERGELQGCGSLSWEYLQDAGWAKAGSARYIFSISLAPSAQRPEAPPFLTS